MLYKTRNFSSHSAAEKFRVLRPFAISPVNRETPFPQEAFPSPEEVKALAPGRSSKVDFRSAAPPPRGCPLPLYPSCEKGVLKSPQVFQNSKTKIIFSTEYARSAFRIVPHKKAAAQCFVQPPHIPPHSLRYRPALPHQMSCCRRMPLPHKCLPFLHSPSLPCSYAPYSHTAAIFRRNLRSKEVPHRQPSA